MELERLNSAQFERFREFIYKKCGIRVHENKLTLLSNRIRRRLKSGDFRDFDAYYQFLTSPGGVRELARFLDAITTHETSFFRTEKQFDWLRNDLLAEMVAQQRAGHRERTLRMWSAGCASGEEPYSMAICLAENMFRLRDWSLEIVATDISEEMLQAAWAGRFKARNLEGVSAEQRRRYFEHLKQDDCWRMRPEIKRMIEFRQHNLMDPFGLPAFDCIFIRNVLIYFDRDSKQVVLKNLIASLADGGYLVVGPSEGVYGMLGRLKKVSPLVYQKLDEERESDANVDRGEATR